jgi:WD40 repeat protein
MQRAFTAVGTGVLRRIEAWLDYLLGYDFFVAYSHHDGAEYPRGLAARLQERRFHVFFDEQGYVAGDDLNDGTKRRVRMSRYLVVIGVKQSWHSEWVEKEVDTSIAAGRSPVVIAHTAEALTAALDSRVGRLVQDRIAIFDADGLDKAVPSLSSVDALQTAFVARRQETTRALVAGTAATLILIAATAAFWQFLVASAEREAAEARTRTSQALLLATLSRQQSDRNPPLSIRLALEAISVTDAAGESPAATVEQLLHDGLASMGGVAITANTGRDHWFQVSPSLRWMAEHPDADATAMNLRDLSAQSPSTVVRTLTGFQSPPRGGVFAPDDRWFAAWPAADARSTTPFWLAIWSLDEPSSAATMLNAPAETRAVHFDPGSSRLAVGGADSIHIWDLRQRNWKYPRVVTSFGVAALAFSPLGDTLAAAARTGEVDLISLDPQTSEPRSRNTATAGDRIDSLAFTPDGRSLIAWSSSEGDVFLLRLDRQPLRFIKLTSARAELHLLQISTDSRWLAVTGKFDGFYFADLRANVTAPSLRIPDRGWVNQVEFSPDSRWMATASAGYEPAEFEFKMPRPEHRAVLWPLGTNPEQPLDLDHAGEVQRLAFSPDSKHLFTAARERLTRWSIPLELLVRHSEATNILDVFEAAQAKGGDAAMLEAAQELTSGGDPLGFAGDVRIGMAGRAHTGTITFLAVSPNGASAITSATGDAVRRWDARAWTWATSPVPVTAFLAKTRGVSQPRFSADGRWLAFNDYRGLVVVETETMSNRVLLPLAADDASSEEPSAPALSFSPNSRWLASVGANDEAAVTVWDLHDTDRRDIECGRADSSGLSSWAGDSTHLAVVSDEGQSVAVYDTTRGCQRSRLLWTPGGRIRKLEASRNGRWLAAGTDGGHVRVWDLRAPSQQFPFVDLALPPGVGQLTFSADNRWLVAANYQPDINVRDKLAAEMAIWPLDAFGLPRLERVRRVPLTWTSEIEIDGVGRWMAVATAREPIRLFDLTTSKPLSSPRTPFPSELNEPFGVSLDVSADGAWVVRKGRREDVVVSHIDARGVSDRSFTLTGEPIASIQRTGVIQRLGFSADARWLALISDTHDDAAPEGKSTVLRLFDLHAVDPRAASIAVALKKGFKNILSFSPDNRWVVTGSDEEALLLVPLAAEPLRRTSRHVAGGSLTDAERQRFGVPQASPPRQSFGAWLAARLGIAQAASR